MISSLIDCILLGALAFTGWRTSVMARELRRLRTGETDLSEALRNADAAINRAAHAVVMLRSEGLDTIRLLESRIAEACGIAEELADGIRTVDRRLDAANDAPLLDPEPTRAAAGVSPQNTWLSLIESRLASGSATNR